MQNKSLIIAWMTNFAGHCVSFKGFCTVIRLCRAAYIYTPIGIYWLYCWFWERYVIFFKPKKTSAICENPCVGPAMLYLHRPIIQWTLGCHSHTCLWRPAAWGPQLRGWGPNHRPDKDRIPVWLVGRAAEREGGDLSCQLCHLQLRNRGAKRDLLFTNERSCTFWIFIALLIGS